MSEEIVRPDEKELNGSSESRRSFLRRFAVGIGAALLTPYLLFNDRFGRNLSEAQAAEIAKRITSKQVGISPECGSYCASGFCSNNDSTTCPAEYCDNGYCDNSYCTSNSPNSCWPSFSCTTNYCGNTYCTSPYCSLPYTGACGKTYDSGDGCGGNYCGSDYTCGNGYGC